MAKPALISVDWGTTSLRCVLLDGHGNVVDRREGGPGIQPPPVGGFAAVLAGETGAWRAAYGELPILMSGMIGSRQGWAEVPYLPCPAGPSDIAAALYRIDAPDLGSISIVPGLAIAGGAPPPEVVRGEETQIVGAMASEEGAGGRLYVLPGTHSKWVATSAGRITTFTTYMTGEVFAAMRRHTILGRLMPPEPVPFHAEGFDRGIDAGAATGHPGELLARLFATRTLGLFDRLPPAALESYLSGLLIGAELRAATKQQPDPDAPITIIAGHALAERYGHAAARLGVEAKSAPPDCAARGHWLIARAANLVKEQAS